MVNPRHWHLCFMSSIRNILTILLRWKIRSSIYTDMIDRSSISEKSEATRTVMERHFVQRFEKILMLSWSERCEIWRQFPLQLRQQRPVISCSRLCIRLVRTRPSTESSMCSHQTNSNRSEFSWQLCWNALFPSS